MVLGECEKAGGLMALPNRTKESLIAEVNELKNISYSATKNDIAAYNEIKFWGEAPVDIEKTLQKAIELSKKYYVNEAGELVVRKGASSIAARFFAKIFGIAALVFDPTELGTGDVLPKEYNEEIVDDLLDSKYPDNKLPLATDVDTKNKEPRKYVTYIKTKTNSDRIIITYSGRTSGPQRMTDEEIVALRDRNHHKSPEFGPAVKYKSSVVRYAVRGLEQQMIDYFGKAKSEGGKSGNDIRGVGALNPRCRIYHSTANSTFGSQLYPHTCK